jgi:hypothetical protein
LWGVPKLVFREAEYQYCSGSKFRKSIVPPLPHILGIWLSVLLFVRIGIKTLRVPAEAQWRYNRTAILAVIDVVPADAMEERVSFDSGGSTAYVSQAVRSVDGAEAENDVSGGTGKGRVGGESDGFVEDSTEY